MRRWLFRIGVAITIAGSLAIFSGSLSLPWLELVDGDQIIRSESYRHLEFSRYWVHGLLACGIAMIATMAVFWPQPDFEGNERLGAVVTFLFGWYSLWWVQESLRPYITSPSEGPYVQPGLGAFVAYIGSSLLVLASIVVFVGSFVKKRKSKATHGISTDEKGGPITRTEVATDTGNVESETHRRLVELDELHRQHLVTDIEYDQKRQAIIDEL